VIDILLREIRPGDLEALYQLDQICFEPGIAYSRTELKQILRVAAGLSIVAEADGEIVGFAAGYLSARHHGHVVTLDVSPQSRRGGIGRALMAELMERLARAGAVQVKLEVDARNAAALAFYKGFGFRRRRKIADYYGADRPAWEMVKEIEN
jgi:[ribosomal protein S18]-alanine N-acetyltransferase